MDNVLGHKTAVAFLLTVVGLLSQSLQAAVTTNNFFLDPTDLYIKKQIGGAGSITRLIDSNTRKLDGICSFDSDGKVDQNRAAIWNRISVKYGLGNSGDSPGAIAYTEDVPAQLANADLVISQKGREVLRKSVRSLYAGGTETEAGADYVDLSSLRLFVDDEDIEINLHFPTGVTMPASAASGGTTPFIYVSIDALTTRKR